MTTNELTAELAKRDVTFHFDAAGELRLKIPDGQTVTDLLPALKQHKPWLIDAMRDAPIRNRPYLRFLFSLDMLEKLAGWNADVRRRDKR